MTITAVSAEGSTQESTEQITRQALVGSYYLGDGTGYNLSLKLKVDDRFECTWTGCLGVYGISSGKWFIERDGLNMVTEEAKDMMKDHPLRRLRLISLDGHYLLLQDRNQDWFAKYGPDTFACFHQEKARDALNKHEQRRIEQASDK